MHEESSTAAPLVSVLTATRNRARLLGDAYASIVAQEDVPIEWVVVDDGSTDDTCDVLGSLVARGEVAMRWERSSGRGVQAARNAAIRAARGEFVMILDDDDELVPGGVATLLGHWRALDNPERYLAVVGRCVDEGGRVLGPPMSRPVIDATWQEFRYVHARESRGAREGMLRRQILLEHPLPEAGDGELRVESTLWRELGRRYRTRYVEAVVYRYRQMAAGGRVTTSRENGVAFMRGNIDVLNEDIAFFRKRPRAFLRAATAVTYHGLGAGVPLRRQRQMLRGPLPLVLWAALCPVGVVVHLSRQPLRAIRGRIR